MSDHYHGLSDTKKSISILNILKEILTLALSYKPWKVLELRALGKRVEEEIVMQKKLLERLEERATLGQVYTEESEDIESARKTATRIKKEIEHIDYGEKIGNVKSILELLKSNRNYIEKLLNPPGPLPG